MKKTEWNYWFYLPFLFALSAGALVLILVEKGDDVLFVNSFHAPFFDQLFYYGTTLGNGWLFIAVAVALAIKNFRYAVIAFSCFTATALLVQFLKKIVFAEMMRPAVVLAGEPLHFVAGVKLAEQFSFPSGHTALAFSLFCLLSQIVRIRWLGLLFVLMALMGGLSRIYLVQHFFMDVYFGALLGVTVTSAVWWWFSKKYQF
ncbi:MAG TPA: phosphatase PAP2 family protein [Chitinophagales bacterium]|nr:phosphatase PAP2 family protein [Chitinophagales bacterium]